MTKSIWTSAIALAVALHAALFLTFIAKPLDKAGAKDKGLNGIDVNLGVLGNLAEKKPVNKPMPIPKHKPKTKPTTKKKIVKNKPKPKVREVVKPLQKSVVVVKEDVPVKVVDTVTQAPVPLLETPKQTQLASVAEPADTDTEQSEEVYKKTTGIGQKATNGGEIAKRIAYSGQVFAKIKKHKRYPRMSRRSHQEGVVKLSFTLDKTGKVLHYEILESSGYTLLDKQAIRMLKKASPFPPFPEDMTHETLEITAPISFFLS